ncbi:type II toxin-antitoxin system VapC family toxin [Sphingorhabdus arenilitoris]|uniref:Ribonuclease VapC n=1 Tax=Sphingorhabdus arenilitoris TaxID=1490041 RepID=A0ABV8RII0_9SPHN
MILVDTNVWSEAFRPQPDLQVQIWAEQEAANLWLASTVIGELLSGAYRLPEGKRKQSFLTGYRALIETQAKRIVDFDLAAARHYGEILAFLKNSGQNPTTADAQIAAMARSRGMALATRNVKDFEGLGLKLINPWES